MSSFDDAAIAPAIGLSEEQAQLIDIAADFARDKSPIDQVRAMLTDADGYEAGVWTQIGELGWLGIGIPENYGGIGLGLAEAVPVVEQMGRHLMATPYISTLLAAQAILRGGTAAQKEHWLVKLATGAAATLALCEHHADWDLNNITCTATRDGDALVLAGDKFLVTHARQVEMMLVTVMFDGAPALVILEASDVPDAHLRAETVIDETRRSYALSLDGLRISDAAVLDTDQTAETLAHIELSASLLLAAEMCGGAHSVIAYTTDYLKTRKQFGKLIGSYQALKHPLVDAHMAYEKARSHLYSAAYLFGRQGEGEIAVRMAKAEADEAFAFAADRAIQFHGGFGFTYDCDAQLYRRRAIWCAALHGDARYHRRKLADLMF